MPNLGGGCVLGQGSQGGGGGARGVCGRVSVHSSVYVTGHVPQVHTSDLEMSLHPLLYS